MDAFPGNTASPLTFAFRVQVLRKRFGLRHVALNATYAIGTSLKRDELGTPRRWEAYWSLAHAERRFGR